MNAMIEWISEKKEELQNFLLDNIIEPYLPTLARFFDKLSASKRMKLSRDDASVEMGQLSPRQKKIAYGLILSSFLFFLPTFFPYETVAMYFLNKQVQDWQFRTETIKLNFIMPSRIEKLELSNRNSQLQIEKLRTNMSPLGLISSNLNLKNDIENIAYNSNKVSFQIRNLNLNFNAQNFKETIKKQSGDFTLQFLNLSFKNMDWSKLHPLLSTQLLEDLKIFQVKGAGNYSKGQLKIKNMTLRSNFFIIELDGKCSLLECTKMKFKVCIESSKKLEELNPTVFNMYQLALSTQGKNDKICLDIRGNVSRPIINPIR